MANKPDLNLSDLTNALVKNNIQMSSFIKQQLQVQMETETILKSSKDIQSKTLDVLSSTKPPKEDSTSNKDAESVKKSLVSKTGDGLNSNMIKLFKVLKNMEKNQLADTKGILDKSKERREFKSVGQRIGDIKENVKDFFSVRGFLDKTGIVKRGTGGPLSERFDAAEAAKLRASARVATGERARDPETGRIMNAKKSEKAFIEDAKKEQEIRRKQGDLERSIQAKYKNAGMTQEQISTTKEAKELNKLAADLVKLDPRGLQEFTKPEDSTDEKEQKNKSKATDDKAKDKPTVLSPAQEEFQIEQTNLVNQQLDLLTQIEENTRPGANAEDGEGSEGKGGGILSGIGKGLGVLGTGIGKLGKGIGQGIKGILVGLAEGITILGTAVMTGVGAVGLAALAGIILTIAAALRIAAPAIKEFAPVLMKLAEQIGIVAQVIGEVLIEGIKALPAVITAIGDSIASVVTSIADGIVNTINAVTTSIERLAAIDGTNLLSVGAGLLAVAGGMAAFAAANVASGISNIATGLMSAVSGQKTPVEQLEQMAKFGPNLNQAGTGVKNIASGLQAFSKVDPKTIEAIGKLPIEKIVAASGALRTTNAISEVSSDNKMKTLPPTAQPTTNVVSAPTTITKQTKNVMVKQSIRNPEGSLNSYLRSRYSHAN